MLSGGFGVGKHYCVEDGNLYIFTTEGEVLLDLNVFPKELNLFEAEVAWRISPWIAIVEEILQRTAENASIILQLNDYTLSPVNNKILEDYFRDGDETEILQALLIKAPLVMEQSNTSVTPQSDNKTD